MNFNQKLGLGALVRATFACKGGRRTEKVEIKERRGYIEAVR